VEILQPLEFWAFLEYNRAYLFLVPSMTSKPPNKLSQYTDPTGEFSNKDLALSGWYIRHKILLRKIVIGLLLTWIVVGGVYSLVILGTYLFSGFWRDRDARQQTLQGFQDYTVVQPEYAARNLVIDSIKIFQIGENYDFVTVVQNPNKNFAARVQYKYAFEGGETPTKVLTILPGKKIPLAIFGFESDAYPVGAQLVIEDSRWRKIDPHVISDTTAYVAARMNFFLDNVSIERNPLGGPVPPRVAFDIKNDTAYSYYEGRFTVLLLSGGSVEGAIPLSIKNFRAGENFPVDIRPVFDISGIDDIEVLPLMDVFDPNEFLPAFK